MSEKPTDAIEHFTDEVKILRQVVDEIRESFQWAVHNDRLRGCEPDEEPDLKAPVFDLREKLEWQSRMCGDSEEPDEGDTESGAASDPNQ